ncbi:hypothetical protein AAG570_003162 [Ranatra chinensis]|uniref:Uncharacterized protein n=1 Tax=Ranatra chinensis TaxID=642074 RepID=A0ABD0Y5Z4_9HEMI
MFQKNKTQETTETLPKENLCMLKKEMPSLADSAARVTRPTDWDRILAVPQVKHRIANIARIREVDNFYKLCQLHREQYSGGACYAEPIKFFKTTSHGESQTSLTRFCPMKHPIAYPLNYAVTSGVPGPSVLSLSSRRS